MIKSFLLKNCLSFEEINIEFESGLSVFSGPSGAGKSVLFGGLLATFGLSDSSAAIAESTINDLLPSELTDIGIDGEEENIFRFVKKEKAKLLVNGQNISKRALQTAMSSMIIHLSSKEGAEFEAENLLQKLDSFLADSSLLASKVELSTVFGEYEQKNSELEALIKKERDAQELKEFLSFEIQKIEIINPKNGEDEELQNLKKLISKKEKTAELLGKCQHLSGSYERVITLFEEAGEDSGLATGFFAQLNDALAVVEGRMRDVEAHDIDSIMNRLEELSA